MLYTTNYTQEKSLRQAVFFSLSEKEKTILNFLLKTNIKYSCLFVSRALMARSAAVSTRTVDRCISRLKSLNIIQGYRRLNKTSIWKINPWLYDYAEVYSQVFSCLKRYIKLTIDLIIPQCGELRYKGRYNNTEIEALILHSTHQEVQNSISYDCDLISDYQYFLKITKKEKIMEVVQSQSLQKVAKKLLLTEVGIAKCSVLDDRAIEYSLSNSKSSAFRVFFDFAVNYSKQTNLPLSWTNYYNYCNTHEVGTNPLFTNPVKDKKVVNSQLTDDSHKEYLIRCREQRKAYYDQLMINRTDLNVVALEYQALGFVVGIEKPIESEISPLPSSEITTNRFNFIEPNLLFDDGTPLIQDCPDDSVEYTLTIF